MADSVRKILRTMSATKPRTSDWKPYNLATNLSRRRNPLRVSEGVSVGDESGVGDDGMPSLSLSLSLSLHTLRMDTALLCETFKSDKYL